MLTLYICRHAKSSWADPGQADHDRPLNERGMRNAPFMAKLFKQRGEPVELMLSSSAARALATARCYAQELGATERSATHQHGESTTPEILPMRIEPALYLASVNALMHLICKQPTQVKKLMLFGHNPGFTDLVEYLATAEIGNLPTAGIVRIDFPVDDWKMVSRDLGTLVWMDVPKRHPGQS
ncbi:MAG: histidine phosphatase family protein [Flavobacteriales bacterium]|nr:histidine phosphatase family protein [Flavobacteriales bacterium]